MLLVICVVGYLLFVCGRLCCRGLQLVYLVIVGLWLFECGFVIDSLVVVSHLFDCWVAYFAVYFDLLCLLFVVFLRGLSFLVIILRFYVIV